ncbi:MAG: HD domain-containing protein [Oscillospiraceae bacterium]|nr:HD domain-containing protein [Oscillospiraceae bacterium]
MNFMGGSIFDIEKLFEVALAFSRATSFDDLLGVILAKMMEVTNSDAGALYTLEDNALHFRIIKNNTLGIFQSAEDTISLPSITLSEDKVEHISAFVAMNNEAVVIDDVYDISNCAFSGPKEYDKITGYKTRSVLVMPLSINWNEKAEVLGVIQLINAIDSETREVIPFGDIHNPPVIPALANLAASALANSLHLKEIQVLFNSFATVMTQTIDKRSSYGRNHSLRVAHLCGAFSQYLRKRFPEDHNYHFNKRREEELFMAAMLHDIGKIVTPINIMDKRDRLGYRFPALQYRFEIKKHQIENDMLKGVITENAGIVELKQVKNAMQFIEFASTETLLTDKDVAEVEKLAKLTYIDSNGVQTPILEQDDVDALSIRQGTLTDKERKIMQEHVIVTGKLLEDITFSKGYANAPKWASGHHEFLDGTGYPNGLDASEISLETSIITVMDIFEALTAENRPYKKGFSIEKSLTILFEMAESGKLSKDMVELFAESQVWKVIIDEL